MEHGKRYGADDDEVNWIDEEVRKEHLRAQGNSAYDPKERTTTQSRVKTYWFDGEGPSRPGIGYLRLGEVHAGWRGNCSATLRIEVDLTVVWRCEILHVAYEHQ